jgi:hypothetical protein
MSSKQFQLQPVFAKLLIEHIPAVLAIENSRLAFVDAVVPPGTAV